ncbi:MAG: ABC transporter permease [bacterium]
MISLIIASMTMYAIILLIVAIAGMFSERSGVINIALEGIMIVGGTVGVIVTYFLPVDLNFILKILIIVLSSCVSGMIFSLLLGFASIHMKADQTIGGTALNVLGLALAVVIVKVFNNNVGAAQGTTNPSIDIERENLFFELFGIRFNWFLIVAIIVLVVSTFVLYKTKFGLQIRACGENPHAADSAGINVAKYRYAGVLISGALAGLGGAIFCIISSSRFTSSAGVAGYGFLALAVMIFGQWKPTRIAFAAFFFSFFKALSSVYSEIPFLANLGLSKNIYDMLPFIACLIILAVSSKNSKAPKAAGIPYDKGLR